MKRQCKRIVLNTFMIEQRQQIISFVFTLIINSRSQYRSIQLLHAHVVITMETHWYAIEAGEKRRYVCHKFASAQRSNR